jgi:tRNA-dihydrouridine synthase A
MTSKDEKHLLYAPISGLVRKEAVSYPPRFVVAPMMGVTHHAFRFFLRGLSRRAWLVTEMIVARAILEVGAESFVRRDGGMSPLLLQLGTGDPEEAARAAEAACRLVPYDGININAGCPSSRVQGGHFGACLMKEPDRVAAIVRAVARASGKPVSVKCRLGLDEDDGEESLDRFATALLETGCRTVFVHARNAWLHGLDPRRNRTVPPLRWERVVRLKERFPELTVVLNGGVSDLENGEALLERVDGVMLGRAVDAKPEMLAEVDWRFYGERAEPEVGALDRALARYAPYVLACGSEGVPASVLYAPLLRLGHGRRGARRWRARVVEETSRLGRTRDPILLAASLDRLLGVWRNLESGRRDGSPPPAGLAADSQPVLPSEETSRAWVSRSASGTRGR